MYYTYHQPHNRQAVQCDYVKNWWNSREEGARWQPHYLSNSQLRDNELGVSFGSNSFHLTEVYSSVRLQNRTPVAPVSTQYLCPNIFYSRAADQ